MDLFSEIGMVCSMSQKNEEAVQFYQRVIDLIEESRSKLSYDDFRVGYAAKQFSAYNNIIDTLVSCGRYEEALLFAEKNKSRALLDLLSSNLYQEPPKISLFIGEEIKDVQSIREHMDEDTTGMQLLLSQRKYQEGPGIRSFWENL